MKTLKENQAIIENATRHYDSAQYKTLFAVDVKMHAVTIPKGINAFSVDNVLQDQYLMSSLWEDAKGWFDDRHPMLDLQWFGRNNGWIGFEDIESEYSADDYDDYNDHEGFETLEELERDAADIVAAIEDLQEVKSRMFNSLWEAAKCQMHDNDTDSYFDAQINN